MMLLINELGRKALRIAWFTQTIYLVIISYLKRVSNKKVHLATKVDVKVISLQYAHGWEGTNQ